MGDVGMDPVTRPSPAARARIAVLPVCTFCVQDTPAVVACEAGGRVTFGCTRHQDRAETEVIDKVPHTIQMIQEFMDAERRRRRPSTTDSQPTLF